MLFTTIKLFLSNVILFLMLTLALPLLAFANIPQGVASADEYVWAALPSSDYDDLTPYYCNDEAMSNTFADRQVCVFIAREKADNQLSRQWGLSKQVVREKDTIYITLPNRQLPLTFRDNLSATDESFETLYTLASYDKKSHILQLSHLLYEESEAVIINLQTGFWQTLWGTDLVLSPNQNLIAGFGGFIDNAGDVMVWQQASSGYEQGYYDKLVLDETEEMQQRRQQVEAYFQADKAYEAHAARKIKWINNTSFYVDRFYKINLQDTAAFRIRQLFNYDKATKKWRMQFVL